jgi:hypothetical protein
MTKIIYFITCFIVFLIYIFIYDNKYYGIQIESGSEEFIDLLNELNIYDMVDIDNNYFKLKKEWSNKLIINFNTLNLCNMMKQYDIKDDITIEILLCLLNSPIIHEFNNFNELESEINIRKNIVKYGYLSHVYFDTKSSSRSSEYFDGVSLLPDKSLIDGIKNNLLPSISGNLYDFSCRRVTEQLILLGILIEAERIKPKLVNEIENEWRSGPLKSKVFEKVFITNYGSKFNTIPNRFYIPGDRIWFKNPDQASSDIEGYEGTWTVYLNNGLFADFWKDNGIKDNQYTFEDILIQIYNWRDSIKIVNGKNDIDSEIVQMLNTIANNNTIIKSNIINKMNKYHNIGGCIDMSRDRVLNLKKMDLKNINYNL